jgi:chemotaxis protein CheD
MPPLTTWVIPQPKKALVVKVSDMVASNDAGAELVTYSLGSCLGVSVYDPKKKTGGLLHLMLPDSTINQAKAMSEPYMFVDTGVPLLFKSVYSLGGDRNHLIVKVAGGAQFFDPNRAFNIGERNYLALKNILSRNGFSLTAEDVGGTTSRTLRLDISNGELRVNSPGVKPYVL